MLGDRLLNDQNDKFGTVAKNFKFVFSFQVPIKNCNFFGTFHRYGL